jgi:hypothetical protein
MFGILTSPHHHFLLRMECGLLRGAVIVTLLSGIGFGIARYLASSSSESCEYAIPPWSDGGLGFSLAAFGFPRSAFHPPLALGFSSIPHSTFTKSITQTISFGSQFP